MIETPSAAFRQSSRERRSPQISSTLLPCGKLPSASFKRASRLDGRTKQRKLLKPHSRSVSTTFEPMKPLDPVTRMRSDGEAICWRVTLKSPKSYNVTTSTGAGVKRDWWLVNRAPAYIQENGRQQAEDCIEALGRRSVKTSKTIPKSPPGVCR